jgi:hypothetical protein
MTYRLFFCIPLLAIASVGISLALLPIKPVSASSVDLKSQTAQIGRPA